MLIDINPKLPMRDKVITKDFYLNKLGFKQIGSDYDAYLMVQRDQIQIHFFEFKELEPKDNYAQVYIRTNDIEAFYQFVKLQNISCNELEVKPWRQKEFSILDPDNTLLTIGQGMD